MAKRYGVPYGMSKNRIARRLVDFLPPAEVFVDLFAGGCAVAHAALESRKYRHVIINDINPLPTQLFVDAVAGRYRDERRVIDRETFHRLKDTDPYVKYCWSFGATGNAYLWGQNVANVMIPACQMVITEDAEKRKNFSDEFITAYRELTGKTLPRDVVDFVIEHEDWHVRRQRYTRQIQKWHTKDMNELHWLSPFERLCGLELLENSCFLEKLERQVRDYRDVEFSGDSVIYCDIPYERTGITKTMCGGFDYDAFYSWAIGRQKLYVSSYDLPENLFEGVRGWNRMQSMSSVDNSTKVLEKLFIPRVA